VSKVEVQRLRNAQESLMSSLTFGTLDRTADYGPVLVSELPAAPVRPSLLDRLRGELALRRGTRAFQQTLRYASSSERSDLLAALRRD
jgi:hypothetical protein